MDQEKPTHPPGWPWLTQLVSLKGGLILSIPFHLSRRSGRSLLLRETWLISFLLIYRTFAPVETMMSGGSTIRNEGENGQRGTGTSSIFASRLQQKAPARGQPAARLGERAVGGLVSGNTLCLGLATRPVGYSPIVDQNAVNFAHRAAPRGHDVSESRPHTVQNLKPSSRRGKAATTVAKTSPSGPNKHTHRPDAPLLSRKPQNSGPRRPKRRKLSPT